jgi:transposase-like protein
VSDDFRPYEPKPKIERMNRHLGQFRYGTVADASGNMRNGQSSKTLTGEFGDIEIAAPRDREGSFTPRLLPKPAEPEPNRIK